MADERKPRRRRTWRERFARAVGGTRSPGRRKEVGRSGTVNTGGFISEAEFNAELAWPRSLDVYDEMRRSDPNARWMLALASTPVRSAARTYEPASQEPEDLEVAAFVEEALEEQLDGGMDEFLRQAFEYLDFGHYVFERIADLREVEFSWTEEKIVVDEPEPPAPTADGPEPPEQPPPQDEPPPFSDRFATQKDVKDAAKAAAAAAGNGSPVATAPPVLDPADGKVKPMPGVTPPQLAPHAAAGPPPPKPKPRRERKERTVKREAFVVSRLAPRLPQTIQQWNPKENDPSRLESITQWLGDGRDPSTIDIEADRLVIFTHEKRGDDYRGTSLLRPAYKAWMFKERLENLEAIAYERSAGFPVVYPAEDATDPQLDAIEEMLTGMRQGETVWGIMPGPRQSAENPDGWLLEDVNIKGDGDSSPNEAIARYEATMARNIMAEFMRLGHENTGARATADVQQDPYWQALEAYAGYVELIVNEAVVRPLVDWNYEVSNYPTFKFSKLQAKNVQAIAESLSKLLTAGGLTATPELEDWIREQMDAPEKPLELEESADPQAPQPPPPTGGPEPGEGSPPGSKPEGDEPGGDPPPSGPAEGMHERFAQPPRGRGWLPGEESIAFAEIAGALDNATEDIVDGVAEVLEGQVRSQQEIADRAVELNKPELLDDIAVDPEPLAAAIEKRLAEVYDRGSSEVRAELRRQAGRDNPAFAAPSIPPSAGDFARALGQLARATAEEATAQASRALKTGALRRITGRAEAPPAPGASSLPAARQAVREAAGGLVNRAFGMGRAQALRELASQIDHYTYTATLDANACGPCIDADGTEAASAEEMDPPVPNPECEGGDNCRCEWFGYLSREGGAGGVGYV